MLNSEGFYNILAMTGDHPVGGSEGLAKPVFDIDSIGLI
jgi:methylenetetrahydrofolate reductase (NADPH)